MQEIIADILAVIIIMYGAWWIAFSRELSPGQKTGAFALIAFIAVALCGGSKSK